MLFEERNEMKKCMNCGAELPEEASFCPYCTATQNEKYQVIPRWPRQKWIWIVGCVAVAVFLFLCLWLLRDGAREAGRSVKDTQAQRSVAAGSPAILQIPRPMPDMQAVSGVGCCT